MPAAAEFPRGWTMTGGTGFLTTGNPVTNAVTQQLPAVATVAHVLTSANLKISAPKSAPDVTGYLQASWTDGAHFFSDLYLGTASNAETATETIDWTGTLAAPPGSLLLVQWVLLVGGGANDYNMSLEIQGYDI